jgi:hypothetical protein
LESELFYYASSHKQNNEVTYLLLNSPKYVLQNNSTA